MPFILFLLFVGIPIAEIAVFIEAGSAIGVVPTLGIVVLTAFVGTWLLRVQGLTTFARAQAMMQAGQPPVEEMVHGIFLAAAGILLLTPGFITDTVGLLLFVPALRLVLGRRIVQAMMRSGRVHMHPGPPPGGFGPGSGRGPDGGGQGRRDPRSPGPVIEGEVSEESEDEEDPRARRNPDSPWRP